MKPGSQTKRSEVRENLNDESSQPEDEFQENERDVQSFRGEGREKKDIVADRRVSQAEMQRRHTWLQRTRLSIATTRNRSRIVNEIRFPETFNGLYCARFSPSGDVLATTFGTGAIQVRNGTTGDLRATLRSGLESSFPVMCCRFNPVQPTILYASSACGNIFMCVVDTSQFKRFIEEPKNEVNTIDVSATGERLVSGGKDAAVRLYDTHTGKVITTYKKDEAELLEEKVSKFHRMRIFASKFHQTFPEIVITGGWDDTVRIWDIRVGTGSVRCIKGPHICGDAIDVRESHILTGSWVVRGSLQIWDMTSGKLIETINPENRPTTLDGEFLYTVQYFDGDPYGETVLAGGSGTGAVEVISLKEKRVMGTFRVNRAVVTLDSNKSIIIFGGMEAILRLAEYN
ncbi:uncharacterized protein LOC105694596 [Orussus abietinus]|uniref:uncharacterized protein LOC105694596 n=1 Tax=Orussus abietinus TaxID=222816 RepID=UPI000626B7B7|nr:uncharacterized protein LOC105694596 [Orussus abietinus]